MIAVGDRKEGVGVWHRCVNWLEDRTGYRSIVGRSPRVLPDGPSWAATSGGCLFWMLVVQALCGLALMTAYSPSVASSWASVFYIEQLPAGRFVCGSPRRLTPFCTLSPHLAFRLFDRTTNWLPPRRCKEDHRRRNRKLPAATAVRCSSERFYRSICLP